MVLDSIVEKIDTPEKRQAVLKDMEKVIKRDISLFMNEAVNETRLLQESLKVLIDTPEKKLSVEERKLKELMIYFLYLIKEQKA
jgi:DNA polymerase III epsilon subunit-like protein